MNPDIVKKLILVMLIIYFAIGFGTRNKPKEPYPVFSWSLFSNVPGERDRFTIRFTEIEGKELEEPIYFKDAKELFSRFDQSLSGYDQFIQVMGEALLKDDPQRFRDYRERVEMSIVKKPAKYDLLKVKYNPLVHYKTGKFEKIEYVESYEAR